MFERNTIITARKRSLGQGNIFAPVCHSVYGGGGCLVPGGSAPGAPGGKGLLLWGGGMPGGDPSRTATAAGVAVRILLECILVIILLLLLM